jgi:hypothetical protein
VLEASTQVISNVSSGTGTLRDSWPFLLGVGLGRGPGTALAGRACR